MMTIDEMIAVLQAVKAGKNIQHRYDTTSNWLTTTHSISFCNDGIRYIEYRVKPEPQRLLLRRDRNVKNSKWFVVNEKEHNQRHFEYDYMEVVEVIKP